jgi:glycine hydroxymethyltransferase
MMRDDDGPGPLTPGSGRMGSKDPVGISDLTSPARTTMTFAALDREDPVIADLIRKEYKRQSETLELIASENLTSPAILEALGTLLTNKYAEGYPGRRYYGGTGEVIDKIETLAVERAKELFGAEYVNVQPHAGSQANAAVYMAVCQPGDRVMGMDLSAGGHLTHGSPANFSGKLYEIHPYGVNRETELIDYDAMEKLAEQVRPKMIIGGFSAYSRVVDWARMRQIADSVGATFVVDMAHVAGLVAGNQYPSPIPHAAIVTTTTQKTLRGAWGAIILCRNEHQKAIDSAVFPGIQGGPLMHAIAAKAVCFREALKPEFKDYARQVVVNAKALANRLMERSLRLVSGGTDNHLMLVDLRAQKRTGKQVQDVADTVGITLNRNSIPFDEASKFNPSGVRVGTPLVTTRGMREAEMIEIADCIADLVERIDDRAVLDSVHERALDLCRRFPLPYAFD